MGVVNDITQIGDTLEFTDNKPYIIPITGLYQLDCYGSKGEDGMNHHNSASGGKGGHVCGYVKFNKGQVIYINANTVVTKGKIYSCSEGWCKYGGSGGMGTFISKTATDYTNTADEDYYLVAGGGGGSFCGASHANPNGSKNGYAGGSTDGGKTDSFVGGPSDGYYSGAGGSGFRGGTGGFPGSGGSNYIGGVPESISFNNKLYTPVSEVGTSTTAKVIVTLVDVSSEPTASLYLGDIFISDINYFN